MAKTIVFEAETRLSRAREREGVLLSNSIDLLHRSLARVFLTIVSFINFPSKNFNLKF